MFPRPRIASALFTLVAVASFLLAGCGSSGPRDMNYGTDVALGYIPPDSGPDTADGARNVGEVSADSAVVDSAAVVDGGMVPDSSGSTDTM